MHTYEIVFAGQLVPGAQPDRVRANLGKLFQADERRLALLMSGKRLVLKNNLDAAAAEKYRATLERAGAVVEVRATDMPVEELELAPPPDQPSWIRLAPELPRATTGDGQTQESRFVPRDVYMAAFSKVEAPDFQVAEVGADMQDPKTPAPAPRLDLSRLSLAPVGSDMGQAKASITPPSPDISRLSLLPDRDA